jgi:hypothetical protein
MSEPYPKPLEEQQRQSMSMERARSEATAMELAPEAAPEQLQVPPTETLGTEEFLHERATTLRGAWFNKAKALAARAQAFLESIEYGGYKLSPPEKRFNGTAGAGPIVTHDYVADRTMDKTLGHYNSQTQGNSDSSSETDVAKIAGRGITALPAVRTSGLMALHGATSASTRMTVKSSPVTSMKR